MPTIGAVTTWKPSCSPEPGGPGGTCGATAATGPAGGSAGASVATGSATARAKTGAPRCAGAPSMRRRKPARSISRPARPRRDTSSTSSLISLTFIVPFRFLSSARSCRSADRRTERARRARRLPADLAERRIGVNLQDERGVGVHTRDAGRALRADDREGLELARAGIGRRPPDVLQEGAELRDENLHRGIARRGPGHHHRKPLEIGERRGTDALRSLDETRDEPVQIVHGDLHPFWELSREAPEAGMVGPLAPRERGGLLAQRARAFLVGGGLRERPGPLPGGEPDGGAA